MTRVVIALAAASGCAAGVVTIARDRPRPASAAGASTSAASTVKVERRDLVRSEELDGVVGHGQQSELRLAAPGTLTRLPQPGDIIDFGQPVAEVDGRSIVYLNGARPAWRAMGAGVSAGEDIRQLEASLAWLGYGDGDLEVDDTWTAATTDAVKRLQRLLGMTVDGRLDLGEVVFGIATVRVAAVDGALGDPASAAGIRVTGLDQVVAVSLAASKADLLTRGDTVDVELPSGDTVEGTVASVGAAEVGGDGSVTFPVEITTEPLDVDDGLPVTVTAAEVEVAGATAVPVEALLALAEGGYAVEVPDATSPAGTRLVGVDVGTFADGWVGVDGAIEPGDEVIVP